MPGLNIRSTRYSVCGLFSMIAAGLLCGLRAGLPGTVCTLEVGLPCGAGLAGTSCGLRVELSGTTCGCGVGLLGGVCTEVFTMFQCRLYPPRTKEHGRPRLSHSTY